MVVVGHGGKFVSDGKHECHSLKCGVLIQLVQYPFMYSWASLDSFCVEVANLTILLFCRKKKFELQSLNFYNNYNFVKFTISNEYFLAFFLS